MLTFKVRLEKALGGSGPSLSEQELIIPSSATVQVLKSQIISQLPSLHSQNPASLSLVLRSNNECIGADNAVLNQIPLLKNDATAAPIELRVVIGTKKKNKKNNTDKAEKEGVAFAVPPPQREPINITTKREAASAALSNVTNRVPTNNVTNRPPIRRTSSVWRMSSVLEDGKKVWLQERNSQRECCFKCGKEVYWNERITVGQHVVVHKACFKCQKCGKRLAPGDYHSLVDDFYCKPHYDQVTLRIKARINRIAVPPSWKQQQPPQSPSASRVHLSKFQLQAQRKEREQRKEEEMEKARKQQEEMQQQQQLIEDANQSTKDDQQQNNSNNNSELEASVSSGSLKDQVPITEELESQLLSNIIESLATKADIQSPGQVLRARYLTPRPSFDGEGDGVIPPIPPTELNSNTDNNDNKEEDTSSAESQPKDESMVDMPIPDDLFDSSGDRPLSVMINEGERTLNYIRLLDLMTEPDLLIAQAVCFTVPHGYRDKINPRIINFYMHHDLCVDLMISLVRTEIEASSEVGTLFRTNGSVSNLLSFFAKTIGLTFLRKTLGPIIQAILSSVKKGIQYELDDNRLEEQGVKDIKKQKKKNSQNVVLAAESFLAEIDEGLDRFPLGIRRICHELRLGTMAKYPDNVYSILGGFLFLRFICPCIIAAQHYGIVDCKVSDEGQRALILVSKTLQQLANGMVFGKKEEYMTILNPFLERNFTPLHDFFDEISTQPEDTAEQVSDKVVLDVEEMEEMKTMFHFMVHQSMDDIRKHIKSQKTVDPLLLGVKIAQLEELEDCMGKLGKPEDDLTHSGAGRLSLLTRGRPAVAPHSRAIVVTSPAGSRRNPHNAMEDDEEEEDEEDEALSTINVNEFENLDDVVSYLYNKDKAKRLKKEQERQQIIQAKKAEKRRMREVQTKKRAEFAIKCIEEKYFRQSLYRLNAGLDISPPTSSSAPASPSKSQEPGGKAVNNNNNSNIHSSTGWRGSAIIGEGNPNISLPKSAAKVISISQRVKSGMSIEDIEKEVAMVIDQMIEPMSSPRSNDGNAFKLEPLALGNTSGKKKRGGSFVMSKKRSSTPRGEKKKERSFSTRRKGSCVALMDSDDGGFSSGVENEFEQQGEERKKKEDKRHLHGSVVTRSGPVKAAKQKKKSGSVSGRSPSFRRLKSSRDNKQDYALPKDMKMKLKLTNEWEKEKEKKREEARMAAAGTGGGSGSASGTTIEPEVTHSPRARLAATKKTSASLRDLVSLVGEWEMEDSADSSSPTLTKRNRAATALVQSTSSVEREKEEEEEEEEEEEQEEGEREEVEAEEDDDSLFEEESDESDGGGAETLLQKYFSTTPRGTHILEEGGDEGRTQTNERKTKRERRKSRRQVLTPEKAASLPLHALRMAAAPEGRANGDEEDFQFFG